MSEGEISSKGIVLYDFMKVTGGAEGVTLHIAEKFCDGRLCVDFVTPDFESSRDLGDFKIRELGKYTDLLGWQSIKGLFNFRKKTGFLREFDWVIFSGSNAPIAVFNHRNGMNILYCHTIPRVAYDLREYWLGNVAWWKRPALGLLIRLIRRCFENSLALMDVVVVNSKNTQNRLTKYLDRDSIVIHPPCYIHDYKWLGQDDFFLSTSRLEEYKRVELVVRAFMEMPDKTLIVTSGGSEFKRLKEMAGTCPNIRFTGWIGRHELSDLMGRAIATIYIPIDEDFGMSPVESLAAGKPVIGAAEGGLLETIDDGITGTLIEPRVTVDKIITAVREMSGDKALSMRMDCENSAKRFSHEVFDQALEKIIENLRKPGHDQ